MLRRGRNRNNQHGCGSVNKITNKSPKFTIYWIANTKYHNNNNKTDGEETAYGAITPRTSGDLVNPHSRSHPSSSSDNFFAAGKKEKKSGFSSPENQEILSRRKVTSKVLFNFVKPNSHLRRQSID